MSNTGSRRIPRFSLQTLLLLLTIVGMAVGFSALIDKNRRLAAVNAALVKENQRLRDEAGELSIDDKSQLHAMRIPTDNYLEWAWRIWIPEGREYRLRSFGGKVPKEGWPQHGGTMWMRSPGEQVVRYRILRDPRDGHWYGSLSTRGGSVGKDRQVWVGWDSRTSTTGGIGATTEAYPPDQTVEICRHRVSQADSSDQIEDPAAGFVIWLQPVR